LQFATQKPKDEDDAHNLFTKNVMTRNKKEQNVRVCVVMAWFGGFHQELGKSTTPLLPVVAGPQKLQPWGFYTAEYKGDHLFSQRRTFALAIIEYFNIFNN
jgi:hypothetical protein